MPTPLSFGPLSWNGCWSWRAASCANSAGVGKPVTCCGPASAPPAPVGGVLPISIAYSAASAASALPAFDVIDEAAAERVVSTVAACHTSSSSASNASEHSAALLLNVNRRVAVIAVLLSSSAFDGKAVDVIVGTVRVEGTTHHSDGPITAAARRIRRCLADLLHRVARVGQQEHL